MHFRSVRPLGESARRRFPVADGQHGSAVWPLICATVGVLESTKFIS